MGVAHRHHPVYFFVGVVLALICSGFGIASSSGTDSGETIFWGILVGSVVFVIGLSTYFLTRQLEITVHAGNLGMRSAISFK